MTFNEAARKPDDEETDEQNLEDLRKKYPWWLGGQDDKEVAMSPEKADSEDTVALFEGRNTCV
jgi:hypothetical protein